VNGCCVYVHERAVVIQRCCRISCDSTISGTIDIVITCDSAISGTIDIVFSSITIYV
jgi:hypothetical protein